MNKDNDLVPFLMSSLMFIGLWGIAGSLQFPDLVKSELGPETHLSIYTTSSTQLTLTVMLIIAAIGMPIVIAYTIYAYRIFRGKIDL